MADPESTPPYQNKKNANVWAKISSSARLSIPELATVISIQNAILESGQVKRVGSP